MIKLTDVTRSYPGGVVAVQNLNLTIESGIFGLVGPNGAGKTSLLRMLAGLLHPTSGTIEIFGHDLSNPAGRQAAKALLGYLPQELGFYPTLTGREFLDYIAILKGITSATERRRQIEELLEKVNLTGKANQKIKQYSGGMKRRLGLAQALLGQPRLVIVDEPTAGLDPEERVRLRHLLSETAKQSIVIFSTHIVEDISQSCRRLAMLHGGRLLFDGAPGELIAQARGQVWLIMADEPPGGDLAVVSALQLQNGVQYRVIGHPPLGLAATPTEPTLEDGYIWFTRQLGQPVTSRQ